MAEFLRDVKQIFLAGNASVNCRQDLAKFVEEPCLAACEDLYDKNILTYWSSANQRSPNYSFILVRYKFLDANNKSTVDALVKNNILQIDTAHESWNGGTKQYGPGICLGIKTDSDMRVADISQKLCEMASYFDYQDILYNIYTPKFLMEQFPFYRGDKTEYCFPNLEIASGITSENCNAFNCPKQKKYNRARFLSNGKMPTTVDMQRIADILGWIYNPSDGLIYKDPETLRRHNNYLNWQNMRKISFNNNNNR